MARAPSVILTPAEKKMAVTNAKEAAKAAKVNHATLTKDRAKLDKDHAAGLKAAEKAYKTAVAELTKAYNAAAKENDKAVKASGLATTKADADLLKLTATVQAQAAAVKPRSKETPVVDAAEKAEPTDTE